MAEGAAVAGLAGTGISIAGQLQSSKAQSDALKAQADEKRRQAEEMVNRFEQFERRDILREGEVIQSEQVAAFAAGGVDINSLSVNTVLDDTVEATLEEIARRRRELLFDTESLNREASSLQRSGRQIRRAGRLSAFGTGLSGISRAGLAAGGGS